MEILDGQIRKYAWGSRTKLAELQGRRTPTQEPEAELWFGAHPASPAVLRRATGAAPLTEVIAADPEGVLGAETVSRYGTRLPFLFKVLAAVQPLSIQAHPDLQQAEAGYAAEEAAGVPLNAPKRTYVDRWHKPELLVAVSEFDALCGFRDPNASADLLAALDVPELAGTVKALRAPDQSVALQTAVSRLLTFPATRRAELVSAVVTAASKRGGEHPTYALAEQLVERYPGDAGVVVAMLLNQVSLAPGEAVWMPAGNLHAYLAGVGIEIMAASDNVLRGGLTPKNVNVPELLRVLRFEVLAEPVLKPVTLAEGLVRWPVPVGDFALVRAVVNGGPVTLPDGGGPRVVFCLKGSVECDDGRDRQRLHAGQAGFVRACAGDVVVTGTGAVYQAGVGEA